MLSSEPASSTSTSGVDESCVRLPSSHLAAHLRHRLQQLRSWACYSDGVVHVSVSRDVNLHGPPCTNTFHVRLFAQLHVDLKDCWNPDCWNPDHVCLEMWRHKLSHCPWPHAGAPDTRCSTLHCWQRSFHASDSKRSLGRPRRGRHLQSLPYKSHSCSITTGHVCLISTVASKHPGSLHAHVTAKHLHGHQGNFRKSMLRPPELVLSNEHGHPRRDLPPASDAPVHRVSGRPRRNAVAGQQADWVGRHDRNCNGPRVLAAILEDDLVGVCRSRAAQRWLATAWKTKK